MSKRPPNANPDLKEVPCCDWGFTVLPVSQISHIVGLRRNWVAVRGHRKFTSGRTLLLSPEPTAPLLSVSGLRLMQSVSHGMAKCSRPIPIEVFWFGVCLLALQSSPVSAKFGGTSLFRTAGSGNEPSVVREVRLVGTQDPHRRRSRIDAPGSALVAGGGSGLEGCRRSGRWPRTGGEDREAETRCRGTGH